MIHLEDVHSTRRKHGHVSTVVLARSEDNGPGSSRHERRPRTLTLPVTPDTDDVDNKVHMPLQRMRRAQSLKNEVTNRVPEYDESEDD